MAQKILAERYKNPFGGNTKGITALAATIKRTKTALADIEASFADSLPQKERAILHESRVILARLAGQADSAKIEVKRYAAEKQKLQERLRKEASEAVASAFPVGHIEDGVAFLAWEHKLKQFAGNYFWRKSIKEEMTFDSWRHKYRSPNVTAELKSQAGDVIRGIIGCVASEAEVKGRTVAEIVAEARADLDAKQPALLAREERFIQEIKAAGVAQAVEAANRQ